MTDPCLNHVGVARPNDEEYARVAVHRLIIETFLSFLPQYRTKVLQVLSDNVIRLTALDSGNQVSSTEAIVVAIIGRGARMMGKVVLYAKLSLKTAGETLMTWDSG
jgi:hypothetical protein